MKNVIALLAFSLLALASKSSFAYFKVCNNHPATIWVADANYQASVTKIAETPACYTEQIQGSGCYYSDWKVQGWWKLATGQCATTISSALTNTRVYVDIDAADGATLPNSATLQVQQAAFSFDEQVTSHGSHCIEGSGVFDPCTTQPYGDGFHEVWVGGYSDFVFTVN